MKSLPTFAAFALLLAACLSCARPTVNGAPRALQDQPMTDQAQNTQDADPQEAETAQPPPPAQQPARTELATFGGGCFWCVEAVYQELDGVVSVVSGYSGGRTKNPTYRDVTSGTSGHAEVCQITYDADKVTFDQLLEVFFKTHDPTTLNRQGADVGTQYRSAIFFHSDQQRETATHYIKKLDEAKAWKHPVVTEVTKFAKFYPAEDYHQNYFRTNPSEGYCRAVIRPKMEKFRAVFKDQLKKK